MSSLSEIIQAYAAIHRSEFDSGRYRAPRVVKDATRELSDLVVLLTECETAMTIAHAEECLQPGSSCSGCRRLFRIRAAIRANRAT